VKPTVVFLHGLGRTSRSLTSLRLAVERAGYETWARTYPSRRLSVDELAQHVAEQIRQDVGDKPLVGVTHSMGGILVRHMSDMLPWDGVVMIAPPNLGSRVAAGLHKRPLFRWFYGPAGQDLAQPSQWPTPPAPYAVIAGTAGRTVGNLPSWFLHRLLPTDQAHDGTVTVTETRLPGMSAYAEVQASHTWLMNHPMTKELVLQFLETRDFTDSTPTE
jgi:pimeloyl-ACP methyl ester carboxylesterase